MKICSLASGSSGNSLLIDNGKTKLLVDAGISFRQLRLRLEKLDIDITEIDSVIVTHEHTDHTNALPMLPNEVFVASETAHLWAGKVSRLQEFDSATPFNIDGLCITPFSVAHDALDPVGFTVESERHKLGLVTDIGHVTALVEERLKGSQVLVIEFNHDEKLLEFGPYPWEIKQRIRSRLGHLSNTEAAELMRSLLHDDLKYVVLSHLSSQNNSEQMAVDTAMRVLVNEGARHVGLSVAPRKTIGEVLEI